MMFSRLHPRALAVAAAFALALGVAACSDEPGPLAPGLGIAESDTLTGTLATGASSNSVGFAANRTGDVTAVVCGPSDANFDAWAITNSRTVDGAKVADTVATGTATTGCETLTFRAIAGTTYRIAIKAVTGRGSYVACYAYDAAACSGFQPTVPEISGVPSGYYNGTEGKTGAALLAALHSIVKTGHNGFEYDSARGFLYQDVEDPDDDNLIEDVYAGRVATVDRRASSNTDATDANLNAEHAWPQSCGARLDRLATGSTVRSTGPRGDLHILFAADASANSSRSNFPFGSITGTPASSFGPDSAGNFSRRGTDGARTVFEPRAEKKGDLARAIFYFYLRYVPEIPDRISLENFNVEEATLLQWAQQDPPDAFERARNNEVYAVQGNRNPFIDLPEFLTRIGDFPNTATGAHATCDF